MRLCDYGCGKEAKYQFKNGKWCCVISYNSCPIAIKINSESNKGRRKTKEEIEKTVKSREGYRHSLETKRKISISNTGKTKGRQKSEKHRKKIKNSLKKFKNTEEGKRKQSLISKELWKNEGYREKVKLGMRKIKSTENWKKAQSKRSRELWKGSEYIKKVKKGLNIKPNNCESLIMKLLNSIFYKEYDFVGDFSFWINGKNPDFINHNKKKIIEFFGSFWHGIEITGKDKRTHEKERKKYFEDSGYEVLIIWENELDNIDELKSKIYNFGRK